MVSTAPSFRTWSMEIPATAHLPRGVVRATIAHSRLWHRLRSPIQAVHVVLSRPVRSLVRTSAYDDAGVVVEHGPRGAVIGLELLAPVPLSRLPQFRKALAANPGLRRAHAAYVTALHVWHDLELAVRLAHEWGEPLPSASLFRRASPASAAWRRPEVALAPGA